MRVLVEIVMWVRKRKKLKLRRASYIFFNIIYFKKQFAAKKYKILLYITHDMESFKFSSKAKIDHSYIYMCFETTKL